MEKLVDFKLEHIKKVLHFLLKDRTTGENIIWATDAYSDYGPGFSEKDHLSFDILYGDVPLLLQPRVEKSQEDQISRTRSKAEVFTPSWLCNQMNNYADSEWFGQDNVFNTLHDDHTWTETKGKIKFPEDKSWQDYINSRRLEITCGEAPYLVSRYDAATGELIDLKKRIGLLDRKIRIVNEHTKSESSWLTWTLEAFRSCYGYEYQGDSLLIARINLLMTFLDYYIDRWDKEPEDESLETIADIISWNIWQMDGFNDSVPLLVREKKQENIQLSLFPEDEPEMIIEYEPIPAKIKDWKSDIVIEYRELKRS